MTKTEFCDEVRAAIRQVVRENLESLLTPLIHNVQHVRNRSIPRSHGLWEDVEAAIKAAMTQYGGNPVPYTYILRHYNRTKTSLAAALSHFRKNKRIIGVGNRGNMLYSLPKA